MVQCLVAGTTFSLLIIPTATQIHHTHALVTPTLFQVEYKTQTQSWLELRTSHLTTGKCFILLKPLFIVMYHYLRS